MAYEPALAFNDLLLEFQRVERVVTFPGSDRRENDVEHSYMLTMLVWYLTDRDKLPLRKDAMLRYALVHDFVEVYAGDTYIYDAASVATKHEREAAAAARLKAAYPEFADFHDAIAAYEKQEDAESRFVRAIDKLIPMLIVYSGGGELWRKKGISLEMLVNAKQATIDRSPEAKPYFDALVKHLSSHPELFDSAASVA